MTQKLLKLAKFLGFQTYRNTHGHWIIQEYKYQRRWHLEEKEQDLWLLFCQEEPKMLVKTSTVINMLLKIG